MDEPTPQPPFDVRADWEATRDRFVAAKNAPPPRPTASAARAAAERRWPAYPAMSERERAERSRYIEHVAWLRPRTIGHPRRFLLAEAHAQKRPLWPFFLAAATLVTVALVVLSAPDEWVGLVLSLVPNIGLLFAWVMAAESRDDRINARTSAYFESLQADRRLYREWQLSNRGHGTTPDQLAEEIR